ncbi:hypothetical protein GLN21_05390, partial [Campylobacter coli]|nr:hypothetical protein [Campylobacter coli]
MNANNEQHITQTLEDSINQGLLEMQEMAGSAKEEVGKYNFANSVAQEALYYLGSNSPITSALQPLTHTIHIITSKLEKQLEIAEITLEYINTDDSITIVGKVAGNTINTWILTEGMYLSKVIAQEVVQVVTKGKTPIGIVIFSAGSIISFFFAGKAEEIFKDLYFNQGRDTFKPLENFLQRHFNFPAKPSCPKGSTMPNGSCAPSPQEFWYPLFSFLFLSPYPKPSQAHQEALAKTKELKSKITLASSPHIQSDVSNGYIDERDLQEYKEQQYVLQKEQRLYTQALQDYTQELAYKSSILNFYLERLGDSILPHITENRGLTYNEALNLVSKNNYMIKILDESDIDSIDVNSPFAYLRALFLCENIIVVDEQGNPTLNESNLFRHLGYKDDAAIIFALDKQTLTKDYLNKRKSLYKTIMNLREQREQDYKEEQERISQLSYEEYQREREKTLREQQRQERIQRARNPNTTNHLILETKDKNNVVIFLDSANSLSNLIHIHNNKIDIFTKDGTILDIQRLETLLQEYININHNTDNNANNTNNNDNNTAITLDL